MWRTYLERCEVELVYEGLYRALENRSVGAISERVYRVLTSDILGNPANRRFLDPSTFAARVQPAIDAQDRLQFVLPAFPFKDQNIFRTEAPADHVDLGEVCLLIRLHVLALALFQVHPFGADWIILADGVAHSESIGVDPQHAVTYRERLRDIRNELNLQGTVSILDLSDVASHSDGTEFIGRFDSHVAAIRHCLANDVETHAPTRQSFQTLTRGISWNLPTRTYEAEFSREEIWEAIAAVADISSNASRLGRLLREKAFDASLGYASYNLALKWLRLPDALFPGAIRATVHPKAGQVAVPSVGTVYPWNGVAVVSDLSLRPTSVLSQPWCDAASRGRRLIGHSDGDGRPPLYYTRDVAESL